MGTAMAHVSRTRTALLLALFSCLVASCSKTPDSTEQRTAPSSEELAAKIASLAEVSADFDQVRSILVARGGELVYENYYGTDADAYRDVRSATKSVTSTLIGIAIGDGSIGGVDDTLAQLLPEDVDVMSPTVQATTLHQLLTMNAGLAPAEPGGGIGPVGFTQSKNWVREILANPERPPDQGFEYSNDTSHLLAAIVKHATGTSPLDYARKRLFGPLGIDTTPAWTDDVFMRENIEGYEKAGFAWPQDPQGINIGWSQLKLRSRDMLKLGQLFLDGGRWEGKQIISKEWVDEATTQQIEASLHGSSGYGYQWWTGDLDGDSSFRALGYGGQLIIVVPQRDLVMATTAELRQLDPNSHGIDAGVLLAIIEDAVVSQFPPTN